MTIRMGLAQAYFGKDAVCSARQKHPVSLVADDDIYDAFAALWTAERIHLGIAEVIPDRPEIDSIGLRMSMWY